MKKLRLTQNQYAIVDDQDYDYLNQWKWTFNQGYARRKLVVGEKAYSIPLHKAITLCPDGYLVDHVNGDTLDNRKINLRICNKGQNNYNRRQGALNNKSGYKGVYLDKKSNKWQAQIRYNYKTRYLGLYENIKDAARAYNEAAAKYFGEFARPNYIEEAV
jgi:hypothetical protein